LPESLLCFQGLLCLATAVIFISRGPGGEIFFSRLSAGSALHSIHQLFETWWYFTVSLLESRMLKNRFPFLLICDWRDENQVNI
jgi:hypothetical protein